MAESPEQHELIGLNISGTETDQECEQWRQTEIKKTLKHLLFVLVHLIDPRFSPPLFQLNIARSETGAQDRGEPGSVQLCCQLTSVCHDFICPFSENIIQRYGSLPGVLHMIELEKGRTGLGLSLAGNRDRSRMSVFVVGIDPSGAAGRDGRLLVGDELLEVLIKILSDVSAVFLSVPGCVTLFLSIYSGR